MKKFIVNLFDFFIDQLFPNDRRVKYIQNLIDTNSLNSLPQAHNLRPNTISLFSYQDLHVKSLVKQIKYKNNQAFTKEIAKLLYEEIIGIYSEEMFFHAKNKPIIIPVPMSRDRKKVRGYNQTEKILFEIKLHDEQKIFDYRSDIIFKKDNSKPQTQTLTKEERLRNIKNSFFIKEPNIIKKRTLFIIDDVITTGATISEIESLLMHHGANQVYSFTIAH